MDIQKLITLASIARQQEHNQSRQMCIHLNREAYVRMLDLLRLELATPPPIAMSFEFYGFTFTWSPALAQHPEGYIIGAVWRG